MNPLARQEFPHHSLEMPAPSEFSSLPVEAAAIWMKFPIQLQMALGNRKQVVNMKVGTILIRVQLEGRVRESKGLAVEI
jgi:hypothetical protein